MTTKEQNLPFFHGRERQAFTLLEVLVSTSVAILLVTLLLSTTGGISSNYQRTQAAITRQGDAALALDQIVQDLEGLVIPNFSGGEGLRIEKVSDLPGVSDVVWLTLLTTATDRDNSFPNPDDPQFTGAKRAVSYRIAYQNPIAPARASDQSFALYRSISSAYHAFKNIQPGSANLQTQYWSSLPASPSPTPFPPTHEDAFFAENIVNFQIRFQYVDAAGNTVWTKPGDSIVIAHNSTTVNGSPIPGNFLRAEVRVTALSPEGMQRVRDGILPLQEAVDRYGLHAIRETSRFF